MITIDRLKYFIAVANLEHVNNAAKSLHTSPSVISSAIKMLEEELECKLFERINNRILITNAGEALLDEAINIINQTDALKETITNKQQVIRGHFSIASSPVLMNSLVLEQALKIQKAHSQINFSFFSLDTGTAISRVLNGEIDIALVFHSSKNDQVKEDVLYTGHFKIAVKKNHFLFKTHKKNLIEKLNELPTITFRPNIAYNYIENHPIFKKYKIIPRSTYFYNNNDSSILLLTKTNGWAFLPDFIINKNKNKISNLDLGNAWNAPYKISLIRRKDYNTPFYKLFLKSLQKVIID